MSKPKLGPLTKQEAAVNLSLLSQCIDLDPMFGDSFLAPGTVRELQQEEHYEQVRQVMSRIASKESNRVFFMKKLSELEKECRELNETNKELKSQILKQKIVVSGTKTDSKEEPPNTELEKLRIRLEREKTLRRKHDKLLKYSEQRNQELNAKYRKLLMKHQLTKASALDMQESYKELLEKHKNVCKHISMLEIRLSQLSNLEDPIEKEKTDEVISNTNIWRLTDKLLDFENRLKQVEKSIHK